MNTFSIYQSPYFIIINNENYAFSSHLTDLLVVHSCDTDFPVY